MNYCINAPQVLHEAFDDETVIINLDSGSYYTLNEVGRVIWDMVSAGGSQQDAQRAVRERYAGDQGAMDDAVAAFIGRLLEEQLIVAAESTATPAKQATDGGAPVELRPFALPVLDTYTDMQELLLLDPIHEVDDQGWPVAKKTG